MTTPLSSLLAAASNPPSGSGSASLSQAGSVNAAAQGQKGSSSPAITNAALSQAAALDNAAKVIVERLPERVLAISAPVNSNSSSSAASAAQALNVALPAEIDAKLSKQAISNAQLALLPQSTLAEKPGAQRAVLLTTSLSQQNVVLTAPDKADLLKAVAKTLAENNAAVTLKGELAISTKSESFGQLMVNTSKNNAVPLSEISTEKLDSAAKSALQKLLGQQVVVGLSRASNGSITLRISQELSKAGNEPRVNVSNFATITHKNVSTNLQQQVIANAIRQGGVAIERNSNNPPSLNAVIKSSDTKPDALKAVSALTLIDNKLSIRTAQQSPLVQINLPQSSAPSISIPSLKAEQVNKFDLSQLPTVTAKGTETGLDRGAGSITSTGAHIDKEAPTSLKGSDVHRAITALSRVLLSQTGNTNQALSQLVTIVENGKLLQDAGATKTPEVQHIDKILQQLKGLDALNAKPSQARAVNGDFIGPPKPTIEQLMAAAKAAKQSKTNGSEETMGMQGRDSGSKPSFVSLASLAQSLSAQAKGLSNNLLSSFAQQLTAIQSKGADAPPIISDTDKPLAGVKASESFMGESVNATNDVNNGPKKLSQDMNDQGLSQRLQQLISTQALVTTPINLTSPVSSSSFVQGMVALVQLALAGRAMQKQPSLKTQIDAPDSIVSKTLSNMGVTTQPSRVSQDMNQLDGRQQLLSQLKTLLSSHQQSKVASVDSRIQGQDSFYYVLPSLSQHHSPPELLIKRDQGGQNNKQAKAGQRSLWNITMKLDIGDSGQVLAKSKIDKSTITLDLYASNDEVLRRIGDTLPYLHKRLSSLGLVVENTSYQRGHIPETLNTRPHQIFETRV
ncbi:flagellar hook-length control protein FliK [Alteromonas sp. BL110]|uniref:flagellar hook-length control protein FliK n=1 Tax=Alteromonas sp. BL110 TaxID=1714845 RepID=UPI000E484606|nr:flagellar hook-length control protein FliK [Alteromonas sp. BL110]AXT37782.1 flagellar hook-length control protein FliK [Alteromonas sp. BL110]RKM80521.1 flagellar hook-length control protein FliK [Alteromonas sp. BL110]